MREKLFSVSIYKKCLAYALKAHKEQKTPEGLPYSFHIVSVATEIINSLSQYHVNYDEANIAVACALLHDVNEDTDVEVSKELHVENIEAIIAGVLALTKDETLLTKQEQMKDSLLRLKLQPKCVQMVKLADRITNLAPAPDFWNRAKRQSYVDEAKTILEALKDSNSYLSSNLQKKIDDYEVEKNDNFVVFSAKDSQLILDKNHSKYLKTFKAINRLDEYVFEKYNLNLFKQEKVDKTYVNVSTCEGLENSKKVGANYIFEILNSKNLLNLNTQIDAKLDKFITIVLDGEECIL